METWTLYPKTAYVSHPGSIYCTSGAILAFTLTALPMYSIHHCQPFSTATQFRDAYLISHKLGVNSLRNTERRRMESLCLCGFWHSNDTCFTITPVPFSSRGVDLFTPAGEKWVFRTLPPLPRGCINEQVVIGWDCRQEKKKRYNWSVSRK